MMLTNTEAGNCFFLRQSNEHFIGLLNFNKFQARCIFWLELVSFIFNLKKSAKFGGSFKERLMFVFFS